MLKSKILKWIDQEFSLEKTKIAYFFLGIGLIMFLLDITLMLQITKVLGVKAIWYYIISILSSIILMIYAIINIYYN